MIIAGTVDAPQEGVLEERCVASRSDPEREYRMVRTAHGWQHADSGCDSWAIRGWCRHVKELNAMNDYESQRALVTIDSLDDTAIIAAVSGQITKDWVYSFKQSGQLVEGLSIDGVEAAARESAKQGEAIRELDARLEYEDEHEARFVARAGRYAVMADGTERLLDVAIRAKRQSKLIKLTADTAKKKGLAPDASIEDEFWYEKGIAKAARNAKEALLSEEVKSYIIAEARKAERVRRVEQAPAGQARGGTGPRQPELKEPPENIGQLFTLAIRQLGYKNSAEVLEALGYKGQMDISEPAADWERLKAIKAGGQAAEEPGPASTEGEELEPAEAEAGPEPLPTEGEA